MRVTHNMRSLASVVVACVIKRNQDSLLRKEKKNMKRCKLKFLKKKAAGKRVILQRVFGSLRSCKSSDFRVFGFDQTKLSFVFFFSFFFGHLPRRFLWPISVCRLLRLLLLLFCFLLLLLLSCPLFWGHMAMPTATPATRLAQKTRRACYVLGNERRRYVLSFRRLFFLDTPNSGQYYLPPNLPINRWKFN